MEIRGRDHYDFFVEQERAAMAARRDYATVRSEGATRAMSARAALAECAAARPPPPLPSSNVHRETPHFPDHKRKLYVLYCT